MSASTKEQLKDIRTKTEEFLSSRRNANNIVDILDYVDNPQTAFSAIPAVQRVFTHALAQGIAGAGDKKDISGSEKQYFVWMQNQYQEAIQKLCDLLRCAATKDKIRERAFGAVMHLVSEEGRHPINPIKKSKGVCTCPSTKLCKIIEILLDDEVDRTPLISLFKDYMKFEDVRLCTLKTLQQILNKNSEIISKTFMLNTVIVVEQSLPAKRSKEDVKRKRRVPVLCCDDAKLSTDLHIVYGDETKLVREIWRKISGWRHVPSVMKKLLVMIPDRIMVHLSNPVLLTDFFMDAYDRGGGFSLLALNGVFILMTDYHLDYPNFYTKVYSLLEPTVLNAKYRARFFYLLDIFLTSNHIPEYIVAAFAKRLARLSLVASAPVCVLLCRFIGNLLIRHKGLITLINRTDHASITEDPYIADEPDVTKCRATESCLWEIRTLQSHMVPDVVKAANFINKPLPKNEWDLSDLFELNTATMIDNEAQSELKMIPVNFIKPQLLSLKLWKF